MTAKTPQVIWLVTTSWNDYDQHGEYFIAWFPEKPSVQDVAPLLSKHIQLPGDIGEALALCLRFLDGEAVGDGSMVTVALKEVPAGLELNKKKAKR